MKQERDSIDLGRFFLFLATLVSMSYLIINEETLQTIRCNNLNEIGVNWDGKAIRGISTIKGKKKTPIFNEWVDEEQMAACFVGLHKGYFSRTSRKMEVDEKCYNETDFLLCLLYACVKHGLSPSLIGGGMNKGFYHFLKEKCHIQPCDCEKTFNNHLNKVLRTGKDFHRLTPAIFQKQQSQGEMNGDEFSVWSQMFNTAEQLLKKDKYVSMLLQTNSGS